MCKLFFIGEKCISSKHRIYTDCTKKLSPLLQYALETMVAFSSSDIKAKTQHNTSLCLILKLSYLNIINQAFFYWLLGQFSSGQRWQFVLVTVWLYKSYCSCLTCKYITSNSPWTYFSATFIFVRPTSSTISIKVTPILSEGRVLG